MKVYDIVTAFNHSQIHSVVAESMAEAETAYLREYPYTKIEAIRLHSAYVIVADQEDK